MPPRLDDESVSGQCGGPGRAHSAENLLDPSERTEGRAGLAHRRLSSSRESVPRQDSEGREDQDSSGREAKPGMYNIVRDNV